MPTCPGCGFQAEPGRDVCPVCGRRLRERAAGAGEDGERAGPGGRRGEERPGSEPPGTVTGRASAGESRGPTAWEDPSVPFPRNLVGTWTESLFRPDELFRRVSLDGSLLRPVLYLLLVSIAGAFLNLLAAATGLLRPFLEGIVGSGQAQLVRFFAAPFSALLGLLAGTLVLHLFVRLLIEEARRMGATARILCYASGPGVFAFLGGAGGIAGLLASLVVMVWTVGLQVVGVREVHGTSTGRAVLVVLGPIFLLFLLAILLAILFVLAAPELPDTWLPSR